MAKIIIKNIPENIYKTLKLRAEENKKSLNEEIVQRLRDSIKPNKRTIRQKMKLLSAARELREVINLHTTDDEITKAKSEGRK
jgi:plasmid stability protein